MSRTSTQQGFEEVKETHQITRDGHGAPLPHGRLKSCSVEKSSSPVIALAPCEALPDLASGL